MTEMEKNVTDKVHKRHLVWFGHIDRMDKTRWPREAIKWVQQEKGK
jgi:hypothetical protein